MNMGKQLVITSDIISMLIYDLWEDADDKYFFDYDSYEIRPKDGTVEGNYVIPLVHVSEVTVMKEFITSLNDKRLLKIFQPLSDKEAWSTFWVYFDDDGIRSSRWHEFEENYRMKMITAWCEDNGISFRIE